MRSVHLVLALTGAMLSGCDPAIEDAAPTPTPVRVVTAVEGPAAPSIQTNGLLANKDEIRLSFKVGGVIRSLSVQRRSTGSQRRAPR